MCCPDPAVVLPKSLRGHPKDRQYQGLGQLEFQQPEHGEDIVRGNGAVHSGKDDLHPGTGKSDQQVEDESGSQFRMPGTECCHHSAHTRQPHDRDEQPR
jgi:hypothetical protein